jgi:hypothetical protein
MPISVATFSIKLDWIFGWTSKLGRLQIIFPKPYSERISTSVKDI